MPNSAFDLITSSLTLAAQAIQKREVSPRELLAMSLERANALQDRLGCFTTLCPELAQRQADQAEQLLAQGRHLGPLHGIPFTLKDVIATTSVRTTFGDPRGVDYKPKADATITRLLESAGAVLLGKVVSEIGRDPLGPVGCRNPWDLELSPGTSSSGSGAAVAAGIGYFSIGTDTGGSVRHPASNCGLVGMKATFGRVSRHGVWASSWSTDQAGPLTRTVEDNCAVLEVLGKYDPEDLVSLNVPSESYRDSLACSINGVRIGIPTDSWAWEDWTSEEEEGLVRSALDQLVSLGARLVDVDLRQSARAREVLFELAGEAPLFIKRHFSEQQIANWPEHHELLQRGTTQSIEQYLTAQQARARIIQEVNQALTEVDLIAFPTGSTLGDTWDAQTVVIRGTERQARSRAVYRNGLASLTGDPAISIPCGFAINNRLPVGMMLHGKSLSEALLYRVAYQYEQSTCWHTRRPPLDEYVHTPVEQS